MTLTINGQRLARQSVRVREYGELKSYTLLGAKSMAHFCDDDLPTEFDVVVDGTGLVESILAAALARCGKSVLHLDRRDFYGEMWASLMHKEFQQWFFHGAAEVDATPPAPVTTDNFVIIQPSNCISNIVQIVHGSDKFCSSSGGQDHDSSQQIVTKEEDPYISKDKQSSVCETLNWYTLESQKRRLVYDLYPKVLACRGMMVDLLTNSGCSRYVEFKAINKICMYQSGTIEQVPCSRADVFESKLVSMLEKRKMMKFLTFCSNFEESNVQEEMENMTFIEFLRKSDLTENLIQYVLLCISMTEENAPALQGLEAAKLFLNSLGRFDNAPFLYPIFGCGELPQAFCRLCAVFGGVYCLKRSISALILSHSGDSSVSAILCSNGQRITCSAVVSNVSTFKKAFDINLKSFKMSRAIVIVDGPLPNTDGKLALLTIPPYSAGASQNYTVRLLQLDSSCNTAVDGTYMVHLICPSVGSSAQKDLEGIVKLLYNVQDNCECNISGPRVLWSVYFNLDLCQVDRQKQVNIPSNLHLTSDADCSLVYETAVQEAKMIFTHIFPDEKFLEPLPE